jgi:hypothetical protein
MTKKFTYANGIKLKKKNRRISVFKTVDGNHNHVIQIVRMLFKDEDTKIAPSQRIIRNKALVTGIALTDEGLMDVYAALLHYIKNIRPKVCPFCGSICDVQSGTFDSGNSYRVVCLKELHCLDEWSDTPIEAVLKWNKRNSDGESNNL